MAAASSSTATKWLPKFTFTPTVKNPHAVVAAATKTIFLKARQISSAPAPPEPIHFLKYQMDAMAVVVTSHWHIVSLEDMFVFLILSQGWSYPMR